MAAGEDVIGIGDMEGEDLVFSADPEHQMAVIAAVEAKSDRSEHAQGQPVDSTPADSAGKSER